MSFFARSLDGSSASACSSVRLRAGFVAVLQLRDRLDRELLCLRLGLRGAQLRLRRRRRLGRLGQRRHGCAAAAARARALAARASRSSSAHASQHAPMQQRTPRTTRVTVSSTGDRVIVRRGMVERRYCTRIRLKSILARDAFETASTMCNTAMPPFYAQSAFAGVGRHSGARRCLAAEDRQRREIVLLAPAAAHDVVDHVPQPVGGA